MFTVSGSVYSKGIQRATTLTENEPAGQYERLVSRVSTSMAAIEVVSVFNQHRKTVCWSMYAELVVVVMQARDCRGNFPVLGIP